MEPADERCQHRDLRGPEVPRGDMGVGRPLHGVEAGGGGGGDDALDIARDAGSRAESEADHETHSTRARASPQAEGIDFPFFTLRAHKGQNISLDRLPELDQK